MLYIGATTSRRLRPRGTGLAPSQASTASGGVMADDWLAVLALGRDVESVRSSPERERSRSRSRSYRLIRPPSPSSSEESADGETDELEGICHEESPPTVSDLYMRSQISGGIPLFFRHQNFWVSQTLTQIIDDFAGWGEFYIGATVDPRSRWLGRPGMKGHCRSWDYMFLIAYTAEGHRIEKAAIMLAIKLYGNQCTNKASDARGQAFGRDNFIYICC